MIDHFGFLHEVAEAMCQHMQHTCHLCQSANSRYVRLVVVEHLQPVEGVLVQAEEDSGLHI